MPWSFFTWGGSRSTKASWIWRKLSHGSGMDYGEAWLLIVGPDEEGLRPRIEGICFVSCQPAPLDWLGDRAAGIHGRSRCVVSTESP